MCRFNILELVFFLLKFDPSLSKICPHQSKCWVELVGSNQITTPYKEVNQSKVKWFK